MSLPTIKAKAIYLGRISGVSKKGNDYTMIKVSNGLESTVFSTDISDPKIDNGTEVVLTLEVNPFDKFKTFKLTSVALAE